MHRCVTWAMAAGLVACTSQPDDDPAPIEIATPQRHGPGHITTVGAAFGGVVIARSEVRPSPLVPGAPAKLALQVEAPGGGPWPATLTIAPPRPASRQVALGGVGAPPIEVPVDPRTQTIDVQLRPGVVEVDLPPLPIPWHPRRAELLLAVDGANVEDGPALADGRAVVGLVPVQTSGTQVTARRLATPPTIDGNLGEWTSVPYTMVHSLDGEPVDGPPSHVWWGWDDTYLYVAADLRDDDVWSEYTERDDPLWKQEVFEVFVFVDDDGRGYMELQLSPRGVTFDARFVRYRRPDTDWASHWKTAAVVEGTIDDRTDRDQGWTLEVAIEWAEICRTTSATCPPQVGQRMLVNAFRFDRPAKGPTLAYALSPTRVPDFHAAANAAMLTLAGR